MSADRQSNRSLAVEDRADKDLMTEIQDSLLDAACVHAGDGPSLAGLEMRTPPLASPIFQSSVFALDSLDLIDQAVEGESGVYGYSRLGNPTVVAFESAMARLEGTETAVAAASGMGAISACFLGLLAQIRSTRKQKEGAPIDGHPIGIVSTGTIYGETLSLLDTLLAEHGAKIVHMPQEKILEAGQLPPGCKILFTETLSNPLLQVADIQGLARLCREAGAYLVIDNTFASPIHCRPLNLGSDLVVHSATKYLGGHGDLMAGVVCGPQELLHPIRSTLRVVGATPAPMDTWLALRGLRTLHLRMARHSANAEAVANYLVEQPAIERVHFPGLSDHPQSALARSSFSGGCGGMLSFELHPSLVSSQSGPRDVIEAFLNRLEMIRLAPSLADVATILSIPSLTSHRSLSPEHRKALGISDLLIRLSCGIEDADSILQDLSRGLSF